MAKENYGVSPTSVIIRCKLLNSSVTTGAGLTGLTSASAGLKISTAKINDATPTVYTQAGGTIEAVTTLGTYLAPTATKCRFKEFDATNNPGIYEIQLADARFQATDKLLVSVSGATNLAQADFEIQCTNLAANVIQVNGTAQTARDLGASVLLSSGTGTGQLDFTSGVVKANLVQILATALTETAGYLAAGFKKFFNIQTPALTVAGVDQTGDSFARLGTPAGATIEADIAAVKVDTAAVKVQTDKMAFTVANKIDANATYIAGAVVNTANAQIGVNVVSQANIDFGALQKTSLNAATPASVQNISAQTGDAYLVANTRLPAALTANGNIKASLVEILTTALTETVGYLAAGFKKFFNVQTPAATVASVDQTGDSYAIVNNVTYGNSALNTAIGTRLATSGYTAPDNADIVNIYNVVKSGGTGDTSAIKAQTDKMAFTVTNQIDANVLDWKSATAPAMTGDAYEVANTRLPAALTANGNIKASLVEILTTALTETAGYLAAAFKKFFNVLTPTLTVAGVDQTGDSYARIGAPAGASVSADIAVIEANSLLIKAKTDNLPASPAAVGSAMTLAANAVDTSQFTQAAADKVWATTSRLLTSAQTFNLTGNITGNLDGNVTGSVDSVTDPVTVGANNDKTGYALTASYDPAKTAAQASDLATLDAKVVLVKAKTDLLAFTGGLLNSQTKGMDTDVITAAAVSAAAVTKIQTGLALSGDVTTINGKLDAIYAAEGTIISGISSVGSDVSDIVDVLPSSGKISNLALTDTIDSASLKESLAVTLAMATGRFKKDYPSAGQVTFYKQDNVTVAFTMEITDTERTRV
jgi:hypothetical protein